MATDGRDLVDWASFYAGTAAGECMADAVHTLKTQQAELSAAYEMIWYLLGQLVEAGRPVPDFIIDRIGAERLRAAGVPAALLLVDATSPYAAAD